MAYLKFSKRTQWNTEESDLARAHRERIATGLPLADLTASNPTRSGFSYPPDLLSPLTDPAALDYDPNPRGSQHARDAICAYYADHGAKVLPEQILLTTSTSEAYGFLFKLLCDPGDSILVPQPSYPLFDFLADLEVVKVDYAPLVYDYGWQLDLEGLRRRITNRTRAVVLVHPNNPTGHFTKLEEVHLLAAICREFGLALIVDEVFLDYALPSSTENVSTTRVHSFAALHLDILILIISGISKICGLPQMKSAWLIALGPGSDEAMERLEVVADTYLSVNSPIQRALPIWLNGRNAIQEQIQRRVQANLAELDRQLIAQTQPLVNRLTLEGGWYAILRIPAIQPDEDTVRELLNLGVWIHPGFFFCFGPSGWLVASLLGQSNEFSVGIQKIITYSAQNQDSYQSSEKVK